MGIFDKIIGGKKKTEKPVQKKAQATKSVAKPVKKEKDDPKKKAGQRKKTLRLARGIILHPLVSEKATEMASEKNKYVFVVAAHVNKLQIKKAIEGAYGVKVTKVRVIKLPRKRRRLAQTEGMVKATHKAIVDVAQGEKINVFEGV